MFSIMLWPSISLFPPEQNGRNFTDDSLKRIFVNENARISIKISLKFGPSGLIDNKPTLIGAMAWRQNTVSRENHECYNWRIITNYKWLLHFWQILLTRLNCTWLLKMDKDLASPYAIDQVIAYQVKCGMN